MGEEYLQGPAPQIPFYTSNLPLNQQLSPYMQIDPSIFRESQPQYILPEGAAPQRGAFELMFSQIGTAALGAYIYGLGRGTYNAALKDANMKLLKGAQWRSQCITHAGNQGKRAAGAIGGIVMMYSIANTVIGCRFLRNVDDELNSVLAGGITGCLYMSPSPRGQTRAMFPTQNLWLKAVGKRMAMGSVTGCAIAGIFTIGSIVLNPKSGRTLGDITKNMFGF